MSHLKSYVVRIWRKGGTDDSAVLGVVEELEERKQEQCETPEEFLDLLRSRRGRRPRYKRVFAGFDELCRILRSS